MNDNLEKTIVIKVKIPQKSKLKFKIICTEKRVTMSYVLETLISQWIEDNFSINNFILEPATEECEDLKGYISESLKTSFKITCIEKGITMRFALYNLICLWIQKEYKNVKSNKLKSKKS